MDAQHLHGVDVEVIDHRCRCLVLGFRTGENIGILREEDFQIVFER